ncbi:RecF/RecN/SMC [Halteromyces radiatus]|uniref:RecF/RecN/SMC n=1 Tax=Halteromyces radiatus TaxID=101107 RepID=UPI00221F7CD6|nr:RecF/RecN/SMC [Halteromyces radiatus]KAI8084576.1 RecF/RecN/SMC [Halteromyces radiatus]
MVLNNFKSYAVVGPNGSGKSNVIDALLFVFGYRANKMRQGKLSELIHNSTKYPNLDSCSVEVHFQEIIDGDKPGKFDSVPNSRLVVSRQASRNNSSKYYINQRSSNYAEVTTLLRGRGIDLDHKRFLILQGEVESIALMKAKAKDEHDDGLLEYLEDIIGTSKYKESIMQAGVRLEEFNVIRAEKLNRVKLVAREKENLEDKKLEAENYLENENELSKRKNELYQVYRYEAQVNMEVAGKAVDELKEKLKEDESQNAQIEQEITASKRLYEEKVKEFKVLETEHSQVVARHAKIEKDEVELRAKKDHLQKRQEKGKASIESDRTALTNAKENIKKNTEEIEKRKKDLKALEKQQKEEDQKLDEINRELQGKTEGFMAQIEEHQKQLAPWTEKINEKKKDIDVNKSESDILANRISSGAKADADEKEALYRKDVAIARQKAEEAKASMQQSQSRGKVLDSLLRMRDSGRIKGIYDRLGNLGVIDDKYDVAISTACPALDNIVVETVEAGQACIEYLRKNNLGRGVFTVLEKLQRQDMRPIDTPEDVPRLFDLVTSRDEKFAPAFYSVLRDTLVANDLRQANRIAFGKRRWRVVTLDGKLIEKSGAMTGGGNRQLRGAMSSQFKNDDVNPELVASLEKERNDLEMEYRNIQEEKRALDLVLRTKKSTLPKKEVTLEKLQMDARSLDTQLQDDTKRLEELKAQSQPSPQDVQRLEEINQTIERLTGEMEELKAKTTSIQETIESLHEEILDVGGMDLRLQKIVVDDVRKRIDGHNDKLTKCAVLKAKAEKDVLKLEDNIKKTETEIEKMMEGLADLDRQLIASTTTAAEILDEADRVKKVKEEKKESMDAMKKELDEKTEKINEFRRARMEISNQLDDYQRTYNDNKKKAEHWSDQQSKLTMHRLWNDENDHTTLPIYDVEKIKAFQSDKQAIKGEIAEIEAFVQSAKPNLSVLEEYRRRDEEYKERATDLESITMKRDQVKNEVDTLRKRRLDEFMHGFNIISQKLKEMYQMITLGGNAELELVDSLDPFSEGIVFSVMPPKKSWKNISNLSGGEKTLSSLALVFALHHFKPTPLYVMDEIDAALDFRNVSIVANYIAERTKDAQFVIISLRNNMFELADRLVGIYKTNNCTKSIAINPSMIATLSALTNDDNKQQQQQQQQQQQKEQR